MKRNLLRISVVAAVVGLGLLTLAHAQRPSALQQDDARSNPLRPDQQSATETTPPDFRAQEIGPVDTAPPLVENPLRRRANDRRDDRASSVEIRNGAPRSDRTRIQLVAGEEPASVRAQTFGDARTKFREPQLMPVGDDRYTVPARANDSTTTVRSMPPSVPAEPIPAGPRMTPPDPGSNLREQPHSLAAGGTAVRFGAGEPPRNTAPSATVSPTPEVMPAPSYGPHDVDTTQGSGGTGQPGDKQLEGPQNARVVLQKIAPPEIQVGRPAILRTVVRNESAVPATDVVIHDQVPRSTRLLGTAPVASQGRNGELVWSLGTLKPGAETTVEMQIMPTDEGEVGSVATVRFQTVASARSVVTRPKLAVNTDAPKRVLAGDEALFTFTVSNPGSGAATGVTLLEHIPAGLKHPAGAELEYNVGDLKPGESRQLQLRLKAVQAGTITNTVSARADANLHAEHRYSLEVASAKLDVGLNGPKRRYLEREATYQFSVANPGTAPAKQVELVAYLPPGLKFVSANNSGRYDANTRTVYWQMDELPVNQQGTVELVTVPVTPGQFNIKVRTMAQRGLTAEKDQPVLVEGLAAVLFQLSHTKDPLEIGGETTYEISVVNQGSKASTNLQMAVYFPAELQPLAADGPTKYTIQDNKVVFEGLPQLAPKSVAAYRVRAKGVRAGDLRVRCQLMTDEMQRPVIKEESTRVYADE